MAFINLFLILWLEKNIFRWCLQCNRQWSLNPVSVLISCIPLSQVTEQFWISVFSSINEKQWFLRHRIVVGIKWGKIRDMPKTILRTQMRLKNVSPFIQKMFGLWNVWFSKICYNINSTFNNFFESFFSSVEMYNQVYIEVKSVIWSNSLIYFLFFQLAY